jgi:hypothetical protein
MARLRRTIASTQLRVLPKNNTIQNIQKIFVEKNLNRKNQQGIYYHLWDAQGS